MEVLAAFKWFAHFLLTAMFCEFWNTVFKLTGVSMERNDS